MRVGSVLVAALAVAVATALCAAQLLRLNDATTEQLVAVGFTPSQAAQVVSYRQENGDFLQVEELLAVPQISREVFEKVRDKVTVDE